jgi:hypothetical protein
VYHTTSSHRDQEFKLTTPLMKRQASTRTASELRHGDKTGKISLWEDTKEPVEHVLVSNGLCTKDAHQGADES